MALKRKAAQRIDANAVFFPRTMLPSRVQPEFKDCAQAGGVGPTRSQGGKSVPSPGLLATWPFLPWGLP